MALGLIGSQYANDNTIVALTTLMFNQAPGSTLLANYRDVAASNGVESFSASLAASMNVTNEAWGAAVISNLGLTGLAATTAQDYFDANFAAGKTQGEIGLAAAEWLQSPSLGLADATFGSFAATFTANVDSGVTYSQDSSNTAPASSSSTSVTTFTLTTGVDSLTGTAGNDTFVAGNTSTTAAGQTFQTSDSIDGGAGVDTFNATIGAAATYAAGNVSNVEVVNGTFTAAGTLSLLGATGVTQVASSGSTAAANFTNISSTDIALKTANTDQNATFAFTTAAVAGTADTATLTLSGQTAGTNTIAGVETLNVVSSDAANTLTALTAAAATTLNISGDQNLNLGADNTVATTVDASALTGNLTMGTDVAANTTLTAGSGNDTITNTGTADNVDKIYAGAGDDTVIFAAGFANTDTVEGGDGRDELRLDDADATGYTTPTTRLVSGFEQLQITGDLAASLTTATIQEGIEEVVFNNGINTGLTLTLDAGTRQVEFEAAIGANGESFTVSDTGTATDDTLTFENGAAATDVFTNDDFTINGFENVIINNSGTGAATTQNIDNFTINADTGGSTTLTVTGSNAMTFEAITAGTIDFSGVSAASTGNTITMGAAAVSVSTITGSAGADVLVGDASSTIHGGAGNDTITGGAGNDVLNGDDGNDTIVTGAGADTVNGGAGNDVVNANSDLSATDVLDGGEGTDVLALDAAATAATALGVSNFETLRMDTAALTQDMVVFGVNSSFTALDVNVAGLATFTNVGAGITSLYNQTSGGSASITRLIDNSTNELTVYADDRTAGSEGVTTIAALTANNEETLNLVSGSNAAEDFTITTLTASDLKTLNASGSADVIITNAIAGATDLATVNGSAVSGALTVNASVSAVAMTVTAGSGGSTLTTGAGNDTITGGAGADTIVAGEGNDTINSGSGVDAITGGAGADTIDTGAGADTVTISSLANGATAVYVDTLVSGGFTAGAAGDVLSISLAAVEAILGGTNDLLEIGDATESVAAADAAVITTVTAAYDLGGDATTNIIRLSGTFANTGAVETALEDGGSRELTLNGATAASDQFLVIYDDGVNTYLAVAEDADITADNATFDAGDLTVTNLVTLAGVTDVVDAGFVAGNFAFVA
jgi:hypothetical protein